MSNPPNIRPNFWKNHRLDELNHQEWESLCDGCGICCLVKFLDDDNHQEEVEYTNVACKLLDCSTGWCSNYHDRQDYVPDCISLTVEMLPKMMWLPNSCAYKRLFKGQELPEWHFLNTQDRAKTEQQMKHEIISVSGRCVSEVGITDEALEEHLITWVDVG